MQNTWTIAKRQFMSLVNSPVAYIVAFVVLLIVEFMFWQVFFLQGRASVVEMFNWFGYTLPIAVPALTMGLIAEEKSSGTIELLLTMPVRESEVILGKFLGTYFLFAIIVAISFVNPVVVSTLGDLDWGPVFTGYLGLMLQGAAMIALGLMASSWTKSQLIAFFIGLILLGILGLLVPATTRFLATGTVATVLDAISFPKHLESMARGVIDTRDVIFFLSLTAVGLVVSFQALESRRWS
jgi:ABC-2 type transport system permease protein